MKTTTKKQTKQVNNSWVLKNKETGKVYSNWTYPSRTAARKAAKGKRFKGMYVATKAGDGGIDPKKLKPKKPAPMPKSVTEEVFLDELAFVHDCINDLNEVVNLILDSALEEVPEAVIQPQMQILSNTESNTNTMSKPIRSNVNTTPKLRKASSAPGAKFHRHGTFGVK